MTYVKSDPAWKPRTNLPFTKRQRKKQAQQTQQKIGMKPATTAAR
jgi:hypothetical protein